jgi:hypothetical protein
MGGGQNPHSLASSTLLPQSAKGERSAALWAFSIPTRFVASVLHFGCVHGGKVEAKGCTYLRHGEALKGRRALPAQMQTEDEPRTNRGRTEDEPRTTLGMVYHRHGRGQKFYARKLHDY